MNWIINTQEKCLCHKKHRCKEYCEEKGFCEIISEQVNRRREIVLKSKEIIEYNEEYEQKSSRLQCNILISPFKQDHKDKYGHKCYKTEHLCGYICKQCKKICQFKIGHERRHKCQHGHIINAKIFTEEYRVKLNFLDNKYNCQNDDSCEMYTCLIVNNKKGDIYTSLKSQLL